MIKYIFIILFIIFIYYSYKIETFTNNLTIWTFMKDSMKYNKFYKLCNETLKKHNMNYDIVILNDLNYRNYLPQLRKDIVGIDIDMKIEYIKYAILKNYGGIWINYDTIVLDSFKLFSDKLHNYDFVGFGCKDKHNVNSLCYGKPIDNFMISRKNGTLVNKCYDIMNRNIDKGKMDKNILSFVLKKLINTNGYKYFHFDLHYTGNVDIHNNFINTGTLNSKQIISFHNDLKVIILNNTINDTELYKMNRDEILSHNSNIGMLFRKSLYNNPNYKLPLIYNNDLDINVLYIPDRKKYITLTLDRIFLNPTYVLGYDKNKLDPEQLLKDKIISKKWRNHDLFNLGRVACHLGHIKILKNFLKSNKTYCLIFEDDLNIIETETINLINKIKKLVKRIPSDADIVYFSYCWENCNDLVKHDDLFDESSRPLCRHMYLVTKIGAKTIIDNTIPMYYTGDNMLASLINRKILKSYNVNQNYFMITQNRDKFKSNLDNHNHLRLCRSGHKYKN